MKITDRRRFEALVAEIGAQDHVERSLSLEAVACAVRKPEGRVRSVSPFQAAARAPAPMRPVRLRSRGVWLSAAAASTAVVVSACGAQGSGNVAEVRIPPQPAAPARAAVSPTKPLATGATKDELGSPTDEGDPEEEPEEPDGACGEVDARTVPRPSGACTDATPAPGACQGCGARGLGASKCASYKQYLKPKVAKAALDCLAKLPGSRCDACAEYACGDRAMKGSCPDPSAAVECRALARTCPSMSFDDCSRYMSALLPLGRAKLKACMTRCSLFSCAEGL